MRKLIVPLLAILLFITCKKHDPETKIQVCHKDQKEGTSHTITISESALPAHLAHGDVLGPCVSTVTICNQVWMPKNLDVDHYRNGDPIPQVTDPAAWAALTTGAWCYYLNDPTNGAIYGKLYNWYAVNDPRGLAPTGWHIPTNAEWTTLVYCLGGVLVAGGKMKETGTTHWLSPNTGADNSSGFAALPGGFRGFNGSLFNLIGSFGFWWSSTELNTTNAWHCFLFYNDASVTSLAARKSDGYSVRCVKD